jgi:hypothetical protein
MFPKAKSKVVVVVVVVDHHCNIDDKDDIGDKEDA